MTRYQRKESTGTRASSPGARHPPLSRLRLGYTLLAPVYDLFLARTSARLRRASLGGMRAEGRRFLVAGIGTGLDIPYLPPGGSYVGIDLTPAMLRRARRRAGGRDDLALCQGDVMRLPYPDATFDGVVMHLILAVVPDPCRAIAEAARVTKPGGEIRVVDKFLRPGRRAPLRRGLNLVTRRFVTRLDVVFEDLLPCAPDLEIGEDSPLLARGWFRRIVLRKRG